MKYLDSPYAESTHLGYIVLLLRFYRVQSQKEVKDFRWQYITAVQMLHRSGCIHTSKKESNVWLYRPSYLNARTSGQIGTKMWSRSASLPDNF